MDLNELEIREARQEEIDDCLRFRNTIFTPVSREQYEAMGNTAAVGRRGGEIWGFIPLQFRDLLISPGMTVPVVFENAVGVHESARGTGIGSAMIECAAGFIRDRVDALCVYRGGERTNGYRFYRRTHHGDLYYEQWLSWELSAAGTGKAGSGSDAVMSAPAAEAMRHEADLLRIFDLCYAGYGGSWKRRPGFFRTALASHVYGNGDWRLFTTRTGNVLEGYAIVNPLCPRHDCPNIYDLAVGSDGALASLLAGIAAEYRAAYPRVGTAFPPEHPLYRRLLASGFTFAGDNTYAMARILNADRIFARRAAGSTLLEDLALTAVTPLRDVAINSPASPQHRATLFLKESLLSRLMLARLDLTQALRMNLVRMSPLPPEVESALAAIFTFTPWVCSGIDYA